MAKSNNTPYVIAGGLAALYLLFKFSGSGGGSGGGGVGDIAKSAGEGIGKGLTDIFLTVTGGVVNTAGEAVTGAYKGVTERGAQGIVTTAREVAYGDAPIWKQALMHSNPVTSFFVPLTKFADWHYKGNKTWSKTLNRYTNVAPEKEAEYIELNQLTQAYSPGDAGYLYALQQGKDVSNWNTSSLTPEFKAAMGLM